MARDDPRCSLRLRYRRPLARARVQRQRRSPRGGTRCDASSSARGHATAAGAARSTMRRSRFNGAGLFLTDREALIWTVSNLAGLVLAVTVSTAALAVAVPGWVFA